MRIALVLLFAASPAFAGNNELTIGTHNRSLRSDSANAVTEDNLGGMQLTYARQLGLDLVTNLQIWATAGFGRTSVDGVLFGMPTSVDATDLFLGGNARYALHPNLVLVGRLDLGPSKSELTVEGNGHTVSDGRWGLQATAALGVDMLAYASTKFSIGLRFEYGYVLHSATALSPAEASNEEMIELPASQASIGQLDLGGRYFAFSLLSQF